MLLELSICLQIHMSVSTPFLSNENILQMYIAPKSKFQIQEKLYVFNKRYEKKKVCITGVSHIYFDLIFSKIIYFILIDKLNMQFQSYFMLRNSDPLKK